MLFAPSLCIAMILRDLSTSSGCYEEEVHHLAASLVPVVKHKQQICFTAISQVYSKTFPYCAHQDIAINLTVHIRTSQYTLSRITNAKITRTYTDQDPVFFSLPMFRANLGTGVKPSACGGDIKIDGFVQVPIARGCGFRHSTPLCVLSQAYLLV